MNQRLSLTIIAVLFAFSFQQYDIDLSKYTEGSVEADVMNCFNNKDTSTCSQVPMKSGIYQCCRTRISSSYYNSYQNGWIYDMCNIWISQDFTQDQIESMQVLTKKLLLSFLLCIISIFLIIKWNTHVLKILTH